MAERVFVTKLTNVGFAEPEVLDRQPFGLEHASAYPLFTPDLIELMRRLLSPERQAAVATMLVVRAVRP